MHMHVAIYLDTPTNTRSSHVPMKTIKENKKKKPFPELLTINNIFLKIVKVVWKCFINHFLIVKIFSRFKKKKSELFNFIGLFFADACLNWYI